MFSRVAMRSDGQGISPRKRGVVQKDEECIQTCRFKPTESEERPIYLKPKVIGLGEVLSHCLLVVGFRDFI